jgi:dihydrofolate synthase/folylpolyglutamate synthase
LNIIEASAWLDSHLDHESTSTGIAAGAVEGLSLEPMQQLVSVLGDPQGAMPVIHVTGTNGKGSTVAMISALIQASGLSVGEYTSPHLGRLNERIARDGEPIPDEDLAEVLSGIAAVEDLLAVRPSWFEIVTAAALRWFAEAPVDVAVVEVGLLGRFDATNVVSADVAVVTSVGGDHTDFSEGWEVAVAQEKAGIVTPGRPVVLGRVAPELVPLFSAEGADPVLRLGEEFGLTRRRAGVGAQVLDLFGVRGDHDDVELALHGAHQADNAAVAVATVEELLDRRLDDEVVGEAFSRVRAPGRLEVIGHQPLVVLDGAHNADALVAMATTLDEDFSVLGSRIVVMGMLAGRDAGASLAAMEVLRADLVICTTIEGPRGLPATELAAAARIRGIPAEVVEDPGAAVLTALRAAGEEDLVVVCGSFRLVEIARAAHRSGADW